MRVLVSIAPLTYRQAVALTLKSHRPRLDVRISPPEGLDLEVERFEPHLVVCNETTPLVRKNVPSWVQILFKNGLDAIVSLDGQTSEKYDISTDDLLGVVDETEKIISRV